MSPHMPRDAVFAILLMAFAVSASALPTFTPTSNMSTTRYNHTATLLPNGKVLIAGGQTGFPGPGYVNTAEIYDPAARTFTATGNMTAPRGRHTATLLRNGKVLIAGGENGVATAYSAELYDPVGGTFSATGSMNNARSDHTATLLPDGTVLVAGGYNGSFTNSAETYDPANGTFFSAGSMPDARAEHTAALLQDGRVFIAGGVNDLNVLSSAAIYDPAGRVFSPTKLP